MVQNFKLKIIGIVFVVLCPVLASCASMAKEPLAAAIHKSLTIRGTKEQVWSALTTDVELDHWWNKGVKLEPSVGGVFYEPWGDGQLATGIVLAVEPMRSIRFTWKERPWNPDQQTICEFSLQETNGITVLTVKHSGWEVFQNSKDQMIEGFSLGWDSILPKLKNYIENK